MRLALAACLSFAIGRTEAPHEPVTMRQLGAMEDTMGFMKRQIVLDWWVTIEQANGESVVLPMDLVAPTREAYERLTDSERASIAEDYADTRGEISFSIERGYGARLSAPGYMDCTEWSVFRTETEASLWLSEAYGDDEGDAGASE